MIADQAIAPSVILLTLQIFPFVLPRVTFPSRELAPNNTKRKI